MGQNASQLTPEQQRAAKMPNKSYQELSYKLRLWKLDRVQLAVFLDFSETNLIQGQFSSGGPLHRVLDSRNPYFELLCQLNYLLGNELDYFYGYRFQNEAAVVPLLFPTQEDAAFLGMGALVAAYRKAQSEIPIEGQKQLSPVVRAARQLFTVSLPADPSLPPVAVIITDGQFPSSKQDEAEILAIQRKACVVCIGVGDGPFIYLMDLARASDCFVFIQFTDFVQNQNVDFVGMFAQMMEGVANWRQKLWDRRAAASGL